MIRPRLSRRAALLGTAALAAGSIHAAAQEPAGPDLVEEVSDLVLRHFYDKEKAHALWPAIRARHGGDIDAMLAELGASHTGHYDPSELAYYELLDIYARDDFRPRLEELFPKGEVAYAGIGVVPRRVEGRTHLIGVYHGGPAAAAGLLTGDEVLAADGALFDPVASFRDKAGRPVRLEIRRERGGPVQALTVTPQRIRPNAFFHEALRASMRVTRREGRRLGYARVWSYARWRHHDLLAEELARGRLKDAEGLVLDLRGGWGGAQPHYAELFLGGGPIMTTTDREGETAYASFRWRRPLVVLIDQGSRSGKEVLAYGFKRRGIPLVGTRTAGALLAGRGFMLADGSLLILAVLDVRVEGERLEGVGVAPTVEVPFDPAYAAGADPQLEAAEGELLGLL